MPRPQREGTAKVLQVKRSGANVCHNAVPLEEAGRMIESAYKRREYCRAEIDGEVIGECAKGIHPDRPHNWYWWHGCDPD